MVSSRTGDLLLHMGDATPALIREMNQHGPPPLVSATRPLSAAGNLLDIDGQLREIANRAQIQADASTENPSLTNPTPGFITLDSLHGMGVMSGIPFAVIVDGCLQDVAFTETMNALGFEYNEYEPARLYYVGTSETVTREAWDMAAAMRNFGRQRPFLKGADPVILSAKPGTFAMARSNPFLIGGPAIGPLADKSHMLAQATLMSRAPWDLVALVKRLADFNGVGEINLEGSISWSDFEGWRAAKPSTPMLSGGESVPEAKFTRQESGAVVQRFTPGIGPIQDCAFAEASKTFFLSDFDDNLWTWKPGGNSERVEAELAFSSLAASSTGLFIYHGGQTNELRAASPGKPLLAENLYLGFMAPGHHGASILIFEDDSIVENPSRVQRLTPPNHLESIGTLETTGVISAVEWEPGKIFFVDDSRAIHCWENGQTRDFCRGLAEPQWLACDDQFLYCLSKTSRTLHRVSPSGKIEAANLETLDLKRSVNTRAFQGCSDGKILIGADSEILLIDPSRLSWQAF